MNERLARLMAIGLTLVLAVAVGACGKGERRGGGEESPAA